MNLADLEVLLVKQVGKHSGDTSTAASQKHHMLGTTYAGLFSRELKHIQMNPAHSERAAVLKAVRDGDLGT